MTPEQAHQQWQATRVRRWHANPALAHTEDPVGAHSARVAIMLLYLDPKISRTALIYALQHDLAELITGDVPHPIKARDPEFNAALSRADRDTNISMGIATDDLSHKELSLIQICDKVDGYLWMKAHHSRTMPEDLFEAWEQCLKAAYEHAEVLDAVYGTDFESHLRAFVETATYRGSLT